MPRAPSSTPGANPRPSFWAIVPWCVLALVIAVGTVLKNDVLILADPAATRIEGRIVSRAPDGTLNFREDRGTEALKQGGTRERDRHFTLGEVAIISPLADRSVTGNYRLGSELWRAGKSLYSEGVHGFLYLPQAALLFMPFEVLPPAIGEVLWRWVGLFMYAWGVWRLCRSTFPGDTPRAFLIASLLAIPASFGSVQNGQTNLVMGGLFALGVLDASVSRHWRATLWFMLALACKPVALPVILLTAAVYPRLIVPLIVGVVVFVLVPFVHVHPSYVLAQYDGALTKMLSASDPASGQADALFTDIRGMLTDFGFATSDKILLPVRAAFAAVFFVVCLWMRLRIAEPARAVYLLTLGAGYIMLFNPRTEGVTYAMIGPPAAILATGAILARRTLETTALVGYCLILQFSMQITGPIDRLLPKRFLAADGQRVPEDEAKHVPRKYWLRPLCTFALVGYVLVLSSRRRPIAEKPPAEAGV